MVAVDLRNCFVGTWSLVDYLLTRADGVIRKPWGDDVTGLLMYSADGYMSANLMPRTRKRAAHPDLQAAINGKSYRSSRYIGYAGLFTVDAGTITHHVEVSLFPSWIGLPQVRYYEISPDKLVLRTPPISRLGKHLVGQLTWKRLGQD